MKEMETPDYERGKRPQGLHQAVCEANHPHVRKPAEIDGDSGAGKTTAPLGNIHRGELPGSPSRMEQSRVHTQMRGLAAGTGRAERSETDRLNSQSGGEACGLGSISVLAGTLRRWRNCASAQAEIASRRLRRTRCQFRHDHQEISGLGLTSFLPLSFILQTLTRFINCGIRANIGTEHSGIFRNVQHPDLRADTAKPKRRSQSPCFFEVTDSL